LNLLVKPRINLVCICENFAGKKGMFFAQRAGAMKFIDLQGKDIVAKGADTPFMTLPAGGLTMLRFPIKHGFGS